PGDLSMHRVEIGARGQDRDLLRPGAALRALPGHPHGVALRPLPGDGHADADGALHHREAGAGGVLRDAVLLAQEARLVRHIKFDAARGLVTGCSAGPVIPRGVPWVGPGLGASAQGPGFFLFSPYSAGRRWHFSPTRQRGPPSLARRAEMPPSPTVV